MRLRLILSFALVVFVSIVSIVLLVRQGTERAVVNFMYRGGALGLEDLVTELEDYYQSQRTWQGVETFVHFLSRGRGRGAGQQFGSGGLSAQGFILADAQGRVLVSSNTSKTDGVLNESELRNAINLEVGGEIVGLLWVEGSTTFSRGAEQFLVDRLSGAAITAALIAGGVSLLLALYLANRLLRPVQNLTNAAQLMSQGDLSQRVPISGNDEMSMLGSAFNHMALTLQQVNESRRALTADIAHELRTPLAVQRAHLEAIQDGIYPLTLENLEPIHDQTLLLSRLVEDLRTLALADSGQITLELVPTDLPSLIRRVVDRFVIQAASQNLSINVDTPGNCPVVNIDPGRIEQLLGNLLSNAMRHTPPGGKIDTRVECSNQQVIVQVRDSGPGIDSQALPHVFERFFRVDKSRSRSEGGTGLGLAIARQIADLHGGKLNASNHPQGGAVFTLVIPIKNMPGGEK